MYDGVPSCWAFLPRQVWMLNARLFVGCVQDVGQGDKISPPWVLALKVHPYGEVLQTQRASA